MSGKILKFIGYLLGDVDNDFIPKKVRDLRAVAFESKIPAYDNTDLVHCTEWSNGEGFDFSVNNKLISLSNDEINNMLACLDELNYFEL